MSYIGGTMYDAGRCPVCAGVIWNGRCEDPDCIHHWQSVQDDEPAPQTNKEETRFYILWRNYLC